MKQKNILITGAAGNIGSALVARLLDDTEFHITALDNLSTGDIGKLPQPQRRLRFIKCDVNKYRDISEVFCSTTFDYVFHFAAVVGVARTLANPTSVLDDIDGIKTILNLCKNAGVRRVFFSSSSEVYGEPVSLPQHEELTPLNSRLPYAIVKNVGEAYFKAYFQEHGLPYTIFRFFNTYGPAQTTDFVIPRFIHAAINDMPLFIYGDGSQTRTFCYIDDTVDCITQCLIQETFINDTLNVGSDVETTILRLAELTVKATGSASEIHHLPALPEGDMSRRQPDITKMLHLLGRPLISLDEGLARVVHFQKNSSSAISVASH